MRQFLLLSLLLLYFPDEAQVLRRTNVGEVSSASVASLFSDKPRSFGEYDYRPARSCDETLRAGLQLVLPNTVPPCDLPPGVQGRHFSSLPAPGAPPPSRSTSASARSTTRLALRLSPSGLLDLGEPPAKHPEEAVRWPARARSRVTALSK